jgi:enoyl-CoA hydratase/carnithine racemase
MAPDKIDGRFAEIADALLHGAPGALRELKRELECFGAPTVLEILSRRPSHDPARSDEAREGVAAFKEKRKPRWYPQ